MPTAILAWTPFDPWHLLFFGLIALLLFGKRLPEVGRSLGKGIAEFKKGLHDVQAELNRDEPEEPRPKLRSPERDADAANRLPPDSPDEGSAGEAPRAHTSDREQR